MICRCSYWIGIVFDNGCTKDGKPKEKINLDSPTMDSFSIYSATTIKGTMFNLIGIYNDTNDGKGMWLFPLVRKSFIISMLLEDEV